MQELTRNDRAITSHFVAVLVIDRVSDDWMSDKRKMDPDLVGPAGDWFRRKQRSIPNSLIDMKLGFRWSATRRDRHPQPITYIATDWGVDHATFRFDLIANQCDVAFLDLRFAHCCRRVE